MYRNRLVTGVSVFVLLVGMITGIPAQQDGSTTVDTELHETTYSVDELLEWTRRGQGYVDDFRGQALQMAEQDGSKGVILSSPERFGTRTIVRFQAFTLTPGTVLVTMLSASDEADQHHLSIPVKNRGGAGFWVNNTSNYFFAFHNAAHMKKPFVVRFDNGEKDLIAQAEERVMNTGRWYDVEVGRWKDRVWLKIDGNTLFQGTDADPASGGHVVLRIRGTGIQQANCLVRDLQVLTPEK